MSTSSQHETPTRSSTLSETPCLRCRARHRGCDRVLPVCGTCQSLELEEQCIYRAPGEIWPTPDLPRIYNDHLSHTNNDTDINPPPSKRLKISELVPRETNGSLANSPASEILASPSMMQLGTPTQEIPSHKLPSTAPPPSSATIESLRKKWAEKLSHIQGKPPTPGSGSLRATEVVEIIRVLSASHPNLSIEFNLERKELLKMIELKRHGHQYGTFNWAELSSLRLIFLAPALDRSSLERLESDACQVDLEAREKRPFPLTAVRRLKRVFERRVPNYEQNQLYQEIISALESEEVTKKPLGGNVLTKCLALLFPRRSETQSTPSMAAKSTSRSAKKRDAADAVDSRGKASKPVDRPAPVPPIAQTTATPVSSARRHEAVSCTSRRSRYSDDFLGDLTASKSSFDVYLNVHYPILPIFDGVFLAEAFHQCRDLGNPADANHAAIIAFCLARGSLETAGLEAPAVTTADHWLRRGQALVPSINGDNKVLDLVRCHVLQAQYHFQAGDLNEASVHMSSAVSRAHSEGMHTKAGAFVQISEAKLQLRRTIWHAVQVLERSLALYRGLEPPNFCSDCDAPLPTIQQAEPVNRSQASVLRSVGFHAFDAWARLYQGVDNLMEMERDFRIQDNGCHLDKINTCDFGPYHEAHERLSRWKKSLSQNLTNWNDSDSDTAWLRKIIQLRYLYFRLRLHRPLLILAIGLSHDCADCSIGQPHLPDRSLEAPLEFALVQDGFVKCLKATRELRSLLETFSNDSSRHAFLTELAEFAYACGLIMIAAHMVPRLVGSSNIGLTTQRCKDDWNFVIDFLGKYEKEAQTNELLSTRISRSRGFLRSLSKTVARGFDPQSVPGHVDISSKTWRKMYGRLRLDYSSAESASSPNTAGAPSPFAWMESQLIDFDD